MAEKEDLDELKDIANMLRSALEGAVASADRMNRSFSGTKNDLINMNDLFDKLVETSEDLPENLAEGKDLQKAILADARLFTKVQAESIKLFDRINDQGWEEMLRYLEHTTGKQGEALEQTAEYAAALEDRNNFEEKNLTLIKRQFEIMQKQAEARKLDALSLQNITDTVNDLGAKIRNPDAAFSSMLKKGGALPSKIFEAAKGSKNLGETMGKLVGPAMEKMKGYSKILFSSSGLLVVGVGLAVAALVGLYALFKNFYEFLDKKVMPAQAEFNKQLGGTGKEVDALKAQTMAAGVEFELLGYSFEEGAALVRDFASAINTGVKLPPDVLKTGKELIGVLKLSAEEAGSLAQQFLKQEGNLDGLNQMMDAGAKEAKSYGLPVNDVLRDLGKFPNILARFGTANRIEFAKSSAKARSYGLDIGKIDAAFGEQLDTFEGSSDVAAKMNAMFGTTINSMELMMETDPTKRMEMLRKELVAQGKEWGKLSKFEQNVITSSMGVDKEMASLMLSSEDERKKLEKKQKAKDDEMKANERWTKGIQSIQKTLLPWTVLLDVLMRSMTELVSAMFGFDEPGKAIPALTKKISTGMKDVTNWVRGVTKSWKEGGKELGTFGKIFKVTWDILKIGLKVVAGLWSLQFKLAEKFWNWVLSFPEVKEYIIEPFKQSLDFVVKWVDDLVKLFDAGINWEDVWGGMVIALKEAWSAVTDLLKKGLAIITDLFKGPFESIASVFEKAGSVLGLTKQSVGDALITKAGKVIEFSPNDNILATQAPLDSMIPAPSASASFDRAATSELKVIANALQQMLNMKGGTAKASQPEIKIEIMDINLDGKKIGEAQVKISRY